VSTPALTDKTGGRIVKYDRATGARTDHQLDSGWVPGEQAFVPAEGRRGEAEGWLVSIVAH
jgi:carotenoid cleavage dioxygenase-like enzyme